MAQAKHEDQKTTSGITIRCSPAFKRGVEEMCQARFGAKGQPGPEEGSLSELVRDFLEAEVKRWKSSQRKKQAE